MRDNQCLELLVPPPPLHMAIESICLHDLSMIGQVMCSDQWKCH